MRTAVLVWIGLAAAGAAAQEAPATAPLAAPPAVAPAPAGAEAPPLTGPAEATAPPGDPALPAEPSASGLAAPPRPVEPPGSELVAPSPPSLPLAPPGLARAWEEPAGGLAERAARVRAAADTLGIGDVSPLARALLVTPAAGPARERAEAAVLLAPGLPAAQLALARAEWSDGAGAGAALAAAGAALARLPRHLESLLWLEASLLGLLFAAALAAGLVWIAARGARAGVHAAHDLADRLDPTLPPFARAALLAVAVLAPAALGEGAIGAALAPFALAWRAGDTRQRRALVGAAALVALALGPLAGAAGRAGSALAADPVVAAVRASEAGFLDPADAARLERAAAAGDPLAVQALARRARRAGDLGRARELLAPLLEGPGAGDARVLTDAAHVELLRGETRAAIALYQRAIDLEPSAELWFSLAQAHVRAIDMEAHGAALDAAQALDAARTSELTARLSGSAEAVVDLPFPVLALRARLLDAADPAAGAALRRWLAPGVLGRAPWLVPLAFVAAALLATVLARGATPSRACLDCGARLCTRCGTGDPSEGVCGDCTRRRREARHGGAWERGEGAGARAGAARAARALALVLPGLAEREPVRPGLSLAALAALTAAAALWAGRAGVVPDPAAVGGSGPLALAGAAAALLLTGIALTAWSLRGGHR